MDTQITTSLIGESDSEHTLDNKPVEEKREQMALRRRRRRRDGWMEGQASERVTPLSPALVCLALPFPLSQHALSSFGPCFEQQEKLPHAVIKKQRCCAGVK